mgnify:CR=1 FL=1
MRRTLQSTFWAALAVFALLAAPDPWRWLAWAGCLYLAARCGHVPPLED